MSATNETIRAGADRSRQVRSWTASAFILFLLLGASFGVWASRLPSLRDHLNASTLQMSLLGSAWPPARSSGSRSRAE